MRPHRRSVIPALGLLAWLAIVSYFGWATLQVLWWAIPLYFGGNASAHWPRATCTVLFSNIETQNPRHPMYRSGDAHIQYEYRVANTTFKNFRISFGINLDGAGEPQRELVRRFPKGAVVDVYFDPANPANSTLLRGLTIENSYILWFSGILFAVCLLAVAGLIAAYDLLYRLR